LESAQRIYHELNALAEEAGTLNGFGEYYRKLSKMKDAVAYFDKAYELARTAHSDEFATMALSGLGNAYQAQRDLGKARDFHKRAAEGYLRLNSTLQQVISLESLAEDYAAMNQTDDALSSLIAAKEVAAQVPALNQYFLDYFLGEFYRKQGQFEKSLVTFREAVEITNRAGDLEHCAYSHIAIAELDGLIGGWEDAVSESQVALSLFQEIDDKKGQAATWAVL